MKSSLLFFFAVTFTVQNERNDHTMIVDED
jgi:hypothetical protein